jgi:SAM-dependent methyltransferase
MNAHMGLFPMPTHEFFPGDGVAHRVLDLACGPGGWALEVAYNLPEVEVVGVDVSLSIVQYASIRAQTQQRRNASFEQMDITRPLVALHHLDQLEATPSLVEQNAADARGLVQRAFASHPKPSSPARHNTPHQDSCP